jgi:hypothetical protein
LSKDVGEFHVGFLLGYFHESTSSSKDIGEFMKHFYWVIFMRPLVKRHLRISCNIFMVLFSGEPSSKDFDMTLMICLLRNLMHIHIMDNTLPPATDTSLAADLSRIKYYRSVIVHCGSALVDDTDFESYWNNIAPVIHNNLHLFYIRMMILTRTFRT